MTDGEVVVTLVHGTFARRAGWLKQDSSMSEALKAAGCHVVPFHWSGKNTYWARARAASQLADHLKDCIATNPDAKQCIVAHSHGGNVAIHAVHGAGREAFGAKISIVTLATPFLYAAKRRFPAFMLAGAICIALAIQVSLAGPTIDSRTNFPMRFIAVVILALGAVQLLTILFGARRHGSPARSVVRDRWLAAAHSPRVGPSDLLAIRAAGDEASGLLVAGQFTGWLGLRFGGASFALMCVSGLLLFPLGPVLILVENLSRFVELAVIIGLSLGVASLVLAFILGLLVTTLSLAFGFDGSMADLFSVMTTEAIPPGDALVAQLEPFAQEEGGLAHSKLYDDDNVIRLVLERIGR